MKRNSILWLTVAIIGGSVATFVFAQQVAPAGATGRLGDAMALLRDGKPQQAQELVATIAEGDPEYPAAQCCKALCLHALKDSLGFLKLMKSQVIAKASIGPEIRKELDYKLIDALFQYRKFEDLPSKIEAFQNSYTNDANTVAVEEIRLAALYERGMKKAGEASQSKDIEVFNKRWPEGQENLKSFVSAASATTNYSHLTNRVLREERWVARMTLGDEKAVMEEVPVKDAARERLMFLRLQLGDKLRPASVELNRLARIEYLNDFPETELRRRIEFDVAASSFQLGKQLSLEAQSAEKAGDKQVAYEKHLEASRMFATHRTMQAGLEVDKKAGIEISDMLDQREDLLYGYLLEKDYTTLSSLLTEQIARSTRGDLNWMMARIYEGIALQDQSPKNIGEAAKIFDDVLEIGFKKRPDHDRLIITAVRWRLNLALRAGELEKAKWLMNMVKEGDCVPNLKAEFIKDREAYAARRSPKQK